MARKDDEKKIWLIVGVLFTGFLIGIDIGYSSFGEMAKILLGIISFLHLIVVALWVLVMTKFTDPNYDGARKLLVWICVVITLIVGIHHATSIEDKQVIIDSHENANK